MAHQTYANLAKSTLASNYTAGNTTITVATGDGLLFPATGDFMVAISDPPAFFLKCTSRSGDVLTVTSSGQEGTVATNELSGTAVTQVITAGSLDNMRSDWSGIGTYANLPASGMKKGDRYVCTDSYYQFVYDGSAWQAFFGTFPVTIPPFASLVYVNQSGASSNNTSGGAYLQGTANAGVNLQILKKAVPTVPYTVDFALLPANQSVSNFPQFGFCVRDSGTGKLVTLNFTFSGSSQSDWNTAKYNSPTSFSAAYNNPSTFSYMSTTPMFARIKDDNTNLIFSVSSDGQNWLQIDSRLRTDFLGTPNEIGFFVDSNGSNKIMAMTVIHWLEH